MNLPQGILGAEYNSFFHTNSYCSRKLSILSLFSNVQMRALKWAVLCSTESWHPDHVLHSLVLTGRTPCLNASLTLLSQVTLETEKPTYQQQNSAETPMYKSVLFSFFFTVSFLSAGWSFARFSCTSCCSWSLCFGLVLSILLDTLQIPSFSIIHQKSIVYEWENSLITILKWHTQEDQKRMTEAIGPIIMTLSNQSV